MSEFMNLEFGTIWPAITINMDTTLATALYAYLKYWVTPGERPLATA